MRLQDVESRRVQTLIDLLYEAARHVPAERAHWTPDERGKSVRQIVQHVAEANAFFAAMIAGQEHQGQTDAFADRPYGQLLGALKGSGQKLAQVIAAVPDERLGETRAMPWGQSWKLTMAMTAPSAHIAYHWGQVCYLQTLMGDTTDYHLRPRAA